MTGVVIRNACGADRGRGNAETQIMKDRKRSSLTFGCDRNWHVDSVFGTGSKTKVAGGCGGKRRGSALKEHNGKEGEGVGACTFCSKRLDEELT